MIVFAGIVAGLLLLVGGGAALVHGASQLAARAGVPPLVVGLTVVAFGTSMPELIVNLVGAFRGETGLAFGNVIGSNIANLALIMGVAALLRPLDLHSGLVRREVPLLALGTTVLAVLALDEFLGNGIPKIGRADSIVLFLIFGVFLYITVADVVRRRKGEAIVAEIDSNPLLVKNLVARFPAPYVLLGVVLLYGGGELTIWSSVRLANMVGIPTFQVGLFIIAVGTSLPELVTSVVAALRRESDLAVGNLVGSNIFNALFILPATALLAEIEIPQGGITDILFSLLLAVVLVPIFAFGRARLGRVVGGALLVSYVAWAVVRAG
ncbi:MAG: calcium/sodium antiporter [Gammaproteobacteria bacterium]|nr:calcium/sodium antiporter [Gammaproteobacteria bacterium]MDH5344584.1 calcium/sodium antiporter [Gammaproteobacteria bacterium]